MTLADLTVNTETMVVLTAVVSVLTGAIGMLFRTLHAQMREDRDNWKNVADGAVTNLEKVVNARRRRDGEPPLRVVAAVVPEHSSPTSARQRETAELATVRARLVAASDSEGLEPRTIEGEQ